jgi:hypothetical protein
MVHLAHDVADHLDQQEGFDEAMASFADAKVTILYGPVEAFSFLSSAAALPTDNDEYSWIDRLPIPNSTDDAKKREKYGEDRFPVPNDVGAALFPKPVKRKNGTTGAGTGDFWEETFCATAFGRRVMERQENIDNAKSPGTPYFGKSPVWLAAEVKAVDSAIAGGTAVLTKGYLIGAMMRDIRDRLPKVLAAFITDEELVNPDNPAEGTVEVMARVASPLFIADRKQQVNATALSVSQFLSLDVDTAIAKDGGSYASLLATMSRESGEEEGVDLDLDMDMVTSNVFPQLLTFMESVDNQRALRKMLNSKKPEDSDDLLLTLGNLSIELSGIFAPMEQRFNALVAKQRAQATAERAAAAA